jgi:hypothetical protein
MILSTGNAEALEPANSKPVAFEAKESTTDQRRMLAQYR